MDITRRKPEIRLWREDLGGFYRYFLKTVVFDLSGFQADLDRFEKDSILSMRKFRTAMLIGIALVREKIFDKRWMLGKLLGPGFTGCFSDRERMNELLDAVISTPEAREHVRRANEWLKANADWKNIAVQSVEGQKAIRVAMMRSAVRTHNINKRSVSYYWKVIW